MSHHQTDHSFIKYRSSLVWKPISGKGLDLDTIAGAKIDFNLYANGAKALTWADRKSVVSRESLKFSLEQHEKGAYLLGEKILRERIKMPLFKAEYLGFFALSKQFLETPDGAKIDLYHDLEGRRNKGAERYPGPFYRGIYQKQKVNLF